MTDSQKTDLAHAESFLKESFTSGVIVVVTADNELRVNWFGGQLASIALLSEGKRILESQRPPIS